MSWFKRVEYVDREVERIVVVHSAPSTELLYLNIEFDTSQGFRFRSDQDVVVRVTVHNPTDKMFEAGVVTCIGSTMMQETRTRCESIPSGGSETVDLILRRCSKEVEDMVPEAMITYSNPKFGDRTKALPLPVFQFMGDLTSREPPKEVIKVAGAEQQKEDFVFIILGQARSGKSSLMCGLATLPQQTLKVRYDWVASPCTIGSSGEHCTEWISRHKLSPELSLVGMDGWGMDTDRWKVLDHIIEFAKGYLRSEIHMDDEIASRPLTAEEREVLEDTRKPNEANVVVITIQAPSLISDDRTVRQETKKIADLARRGNFPVRMIVTQPDLVTVPDCSTIRDDSESPAALKAARTLINRAKQEFGIPESNIYLSIAHNTGPKGMDTPQQRWNIDRMYLKILEGIMNAAADNDATRSQQANEAKRGNLGFYAALEKGRAARQKAQP